MEGYSNDRTISRWFKKLLVGDTDFDDKLRKRLLSAIDDDKLTAEENPY